MDITISRLKEIIKEEIQAIKKGAGPTGDAPMVATSDLERGIRRANAPTQVSRPGGPEVSGPGIKIATMTSGRTGDAIDMMLPPPDPHEVRPPMPTNEEQDLVETPAHFCATHVRENTSGRQGKCVAHNWNLSLQEVTAYDVDFGDEVIKNIPVTELTILEANLPEGHHSHMAKRDEDEVLGEDDTPLFPDAVGQPGEKSPLDKPLTADDPIEEDEDAGRMMGSLPKQMLDDAEFGGYLGGGGPVAENFNLEESIAAHVDNLLIEMGIMEAPTPTTAPTLEEQIASIVDQFIPSLNEQDLEETTFAYNEEQKVEEEKGFDLKETIEEAVRTFVKEAIPAPAGKGGTGTYTGGQKAEEEEASLDSKDLREGDEEEGEKKDKPIQSDDVTTKMPVEEEKETLKEWYNNQKFEALKKLWTK